MPAAEMGSMIALNKEQREGRRFGRMFLEDTYQRAVVLSGISCFISFLHVSGKQ